VNRKTFYLLLCLLGFALPSSQFIPWVIEHGLDMRLFIRQLFANRIGGFFGMDVLVSAVALIGFIRSEGARLKIRKLWLPIASVLLIGVSLGLPLFLYLREREMDRSASFAP
jgi:Terpene cyclase DEP1